VMTDAKLADWLKAGGGVAITGASGWIGRGMVHAVLEALGPAPAAKLRLFGSRPRAIDIAGRTLELETLPGARPLGEGQWLVLHLAVTGADRVPDPGALRALNEAMLADALALAGTAHVRRLVCASSGAVYQSGQGSAEKQAYNDLKRDQEQIARAWAARAAVPLLLPRIFNVGGPYMTNPENYALGSFIRQARARGRIEIGARRPVLRSYVHGLELARVVLNLALDDAAPLAFDTAGTAAPELADLAAAVGNALDLPHLEIIRPPMGPGPEDRYIGDGAVYQAALARMGAPPIGLDQIIRDTAAWLRDAADA
jgi:nucleoside-diphosphate-sugar epimerase